MKSGKLHSNQKNKITTDMYLKTIYDLAKQDKTKPVDLVKALNITKGSVSEMLRKIEQEGYIKYESFGSIELTKKGLERARDVKRNYDTLKDFLQKVLGMDETKAHDEACNLEHAVSDGTIERLDKFLEKWKR